MIKVTFLTNIMKAGKMRKKGDTMELPESTAALLALRGVVKVPGKKAVKGKAEVDVVAFVDDVGPTKKE